MKKEMTVVLAGLMLSACERPEPDAMRKQRNNPADVRIESKQERIDVARIGVIYDDLAYNSRRGIYFIKDTETGKEYIGVSGIGITEVGSHQSGKVRRSDER